MKLAIFCGSNHGHSRIYSEAAAALGRALAEQGITLVFGGTSRGLMKIVADAACSRGGTVHGIVPQVLVDKGQLYDKMAVSEVVASRADRKIRMAAVADGFIAMPGGLGTVEELVEMWVNAQFDGHRKPLGLYNIGGFYDRFLQFLDTMVAEGFLPSQQRSMLIVASEPRLLLDSLRNHRPVQVSKWM